MATFDSLAAFERELARFGKELERAEKRRITSDQAEAMERIAAAEFAKEVGADLQHSGWGVTLETQVRELSSGASLLTPTRSSAGPITELQRGRNNGETGAFLGPAINTRTGVTSRNAKTGNLIRRRTKARRWNGYTRARYTADEIREQAEKLAEEIAEAGLKRATRKYFDEG